jgi:hypothetical protein
VLSLPKYQSPADMQLNSPAYRSEKEFVTDCYNELFQNIKKILKMPLE